MALNFGQMTDQILTETFTEPFPAQTQAVQNAIVTAIKELEVQHMFFNQKDAYLLVEPYQTTIPLPEDFINAITITLILPPQPPLPPYPEPLPTPPPPPPYHGGETIYTEGRGFQNVTLRDLKVFREYFSLRGTPGKWALYNTNIEIHPEPNAFYYMHLYYYYRDGTYPTQDIDTSIWMGDFTQDVTRYRAEAIFYRDFLQNLDFAQSAMARSDDALDKLKSRSSDRSTIYNMSY
jgi:hypothetical protein